MLSTARVAAPRTASGARYFEDCNEAETVKRRTPGAIRGVAPYALDPYNADRLDLGTDVGEGAP
jgi:hypothetical protein